MKISTTKKLKKFISNSNIYFAIGLILIIAIWVVSSNIINNELILPKISSVLDSLKDFFKNGEILKIIGLTILRVFLIIGICFIISLLIAVISYKFKWLNSIMMPFITILRTAPIAAIIIILLLAVGIEKTPYYICGFVIVPIMYEQLVLSFNSIDKDIIEETKMISNIDIKIMVKVIIPLSFPSILSSLLTVFGLGLKVMVMAEVMASTNNTFGYLLQTYRSALDMSSIFALTLIMIVLVLTVEFILRYIQSKIKY